MSFQWGEVYATLVFKMNEWGALYFRVSDSQGSSFSFQSHQHMMAQPVARITNPTANHNAKKITNFRNINTSRASANVNENLPSEDAVDHFGAVQYPVVHSVQCT